MNLTLRQLEVFRAIARGGNMGRAAQEIGLTQSAASMALSELERQLGVSLFDRPGRRIVLNDNGARLLTEVEELLERAAEIELLFASGTQAPSGLLRIGASSTIGNYLMPALVGAFSDRFPEVRIRLSIGNTEQIIGRLLNSEIDLGYVEGSCGKSQIESSVWREDRLVIFCAPDYPLAARRKLRRNELLAERWVLRERGSGTREVFERALLRHGETLAVRHEFGHTEAVKQAVRAGMGIGCLSRLAIQDELNRGSLVELPLPMVDLRRDLLQLVRTGKYRTACMQAFADAVRRAPGELDSSGL
ncbi:LysR family transcriptional regulator [Pontiella agarivorans]|uniref:LysR family transcriptional regulator n=1 Tax=Pontiella agarivorans TaxID=3038953 RepID=A0ABU5MVH4_9BACT|nr:LysR family transcriptional regulator [Pontiella agarivorans]MDZ8118195.1 LysR family transcriptional regulator [Pontiella agarivorans]